MSNTLGMYLMAYGADGWETVGEPIVGQPVWGEDAGAGDCHGCGAHCQHTERHYYCLPQSGTVALCLDCGPEEHYSELTAARLEAERIYS